MDSHDIGLEAVRIEGGLLPAEFVQKLLAFAAPHQGPSDYAVPHGLTLRDEIGRYWRMAAALWVDYKARRSRSGADLEQLTVQQWLEPLLRRVFGLEGLAAIAGETYGDRHFPITHKLGTTPLLLTTPVHGLDRADGRFAPAGRRRSPHALVQEYLNASQAALWGIVANGEILRVLRDNPSLTRPAHVEADLARIFEEDRYADFVALWLIVHGSRFNAVGDPPRPILEHWHDLAQETGERALERLRDGVTAALRALGNGFLAHPSNQPLRERLRTGALTPTAYYTQLLRLVYRLILLFTAEDRGLLHPPGADPEAVRRYREGYAADRLRQRALRRREDSRHADLWEGLQVVLRGLAQGAAPLALPALGGLFRADRCPDLDGSALTNDRLLEAVRSLCFFRSDKVLARINYRDMDTEELGSVYESLLELFPRLDVEANPWRFQFAGEEAEGGGLGTARKLSGSFYTPDPLVQELIRSALEPKIAEALRAIDPRAALLALRIIDPACGSGHFLLAAARRLAAELARLDSDGTVPEAELYRHALREVVAHCIYGVDLNPLAVELCQTALWLETLEPGKPLGFLDHHVRCGNSLVGILDPAILKDGIPDAAYKALTGDDKAAANQLKRRNRDAACGMVGDLFSSPATAELPPIAEGLDALPENTLADVEAKREAWERAESAYAQAPGRLRADLFCAAFFAPKTTATWEQVPTNEDLTRVRSGQPSRPGVAELTRQLAEMFNFFHWHLAFPEVIAEGGFDVVLANPPWERIKLQEQEFFGSRAPDIAAAPNAAARTRMIEALNAPAATLADRQLYREFQVARRGAEAASLFAHDGGRFPLTGVGDVNLYALFAEAMLQLIGGRGRAGVITPTGIATDDSTKAFFDHLTDGEHLVSLLSFENEEFIFPSVHHAYRFSLLTSRGDRSLDLPVFVFFARQPHQIVNPDRRFTLSSADIRLMNPNTKTCPVFRSQADAELAKKIYRRVPVLVDEDKGPAGNPWGIRFMTMFHMSNDSGLFRTAAQLYSAGAQRDGQNWNDSDAQIWVPLYEAKMIHQFDHRWATYEDDGVDSRDSTDDEKQDPRVRARPRYWVPQIEVEQHLSERGVRKWLMGWRDICRSTDERTVIAAAVPRVAVGHTMPLMLSETSTPEDCAALIGNLNSLTLDYLARQKVGGTHLTYGFLKQFPILAPSRYSDAAIRFIVPRVLELTYTATDLAPFALDLGYEGSPFVWDPDRRALLRAELDACYAKLYGVTRDEFRYILDPADVYGEDYPSETFRVLKNREMRQFGEYRTRRLVLEAWDRLDSQA